MGSTEGHDRRDEDVVPMTPDPDWRGEDRAVDLMARLEESLAAAKAARDAERSDGG